MTRGAEQLSAPRYRHSVTHDDELSLAAEAYIYLLPLVVMDLTRRASLGTDPVGSHNQWHHVRDLPSTTFRTVVRPNRDTLYSSAWLDVADEPVLVHLPATDGRYVSIMFYDQWTDVFAAVGSRATGSDAVTVALCDPSFGGELPANVRRIDCPTSLVWALTRIEIRSDDLHDEHEWQDQLTLTRINGDVATPLPLRDPPARSPLKTVMAMSGKDVVDLAHQLLARHATHDSDHVVLQRISRVGVQPGIAVTYDDLPATLQAAWDGASARAQSELLELSSALLPREDGWMTLRDGTGTWGNSYERRALIAMFGLGANPPEDSLYPTCSVDVSGAPLDGTRRYRITFAPGQLPPVDAFWSATVYDARGFFIPHDHERYCLSSRDALSVDADGSLPLNFGPTDRGEPNWLPTGDGSFAITMRLYLPQRPARSGEWRMPAIIPVD